MPVWAARPNLRPRRRRGFGAGAEANGGCSIPPDRRFRNLAGVAYDTRRQVVIMHGGSYDLGRSYGETWEWTGGWRQVSGEGPGIRDHTQLAFDARRGRAVLFGGSGRDPNVAASDTWEFDGVRWEQVATSGPQGRVHHAMQYDAATQQVVLFGGNVPGGGTLNDMWAWDGVRWTSIGSGPARSHARMAFHAGLQALVLAGGGAPSIGLDALVRSGGSWMLLVASPQPSARYLTDMAYDERRGVLVLFGGGDPLGSALFDDTWELDGTTWRRIR
jgi:hypothetical protein